MWNVLWQEGSPLLQWGVVLGASLAAAFTDVGRRRIPNLLTLPLLLTGLVYGAVAAGAAGLADSLAAAVVLALPYVLLHVLAGGGAGDAKLMAGIGAWLGLANGVAALLAVALAGVLMGVLMAGASGGLRLAMARVRQVSARMVLNYYGAGLPQRPPRGRKRLTMPYGLAICAGCWVAGVAVLVWRAHS